MIGEGGKLFEFSGFRFDSSQSLLFEGDREVSLPGRAVGVLEVLLEHAGDVVDRQKLEELVWGETIVTAASLTEAVSLLRQTLGDDPREPRFIQTVHRRGYRFLAEVREVEPEPVVREAPRKQLRARVAWVAAAVVLTLASSEPLSRWFGRSSSEAVPVRLQLEAPEDHRFPNSGFRLAISPDGRSVVFGAHRAGLWRLFHRRLDRFEAVPIPGSESGTAPFFSPDGRSIGFYAGGELKTVRLDGGSPRTVTQVESLHGAAWAPDGRILFAEFRSGLKAVPVRGGEVEVLTVPDRDAGEFAHWHPKVISEPPTVVFTVVSSLLKRPRVAAKALPDGEIKMLAHGSGAQYTDGHLVYLDERRLRAAPFDTAKVALSGPSFGLAETVISWRNYYAPNFAASERGPLVYVPREEHPRQLRRITHGSNEALAFPARNYENLSLSPDGSRLAVTIFDGGRSDIWVGELSSGQFFRLTTVGHNIEPLWTADGKSIIYASDRGGYFQLYSQGIDGQAGTRFGPGEQPRFPSDWMPGGVDLVFGEFNHSSRLDIGTFSMEEAEGSSRYLIQTTDQEGNAKISPDGRWVAFARGIDGELEIFVADLEADGRERRVSMGGGRRPEWMRDGSYLIYQRGGDVFAVSTAQLESKTIEEQVVLNGMGIGRVIPGRTDNELLAVPAPPGGAQSLRVVLNWAEELRAEPPLESAQAGSMPLVASDRH